MNGVNTSRKLPSLDIGLALFCVLLFVLWPEIDIAFSELFYDNHRFPYADHWLTLALYHLFAVLPMICLIGIALKFLISMAKKRREGVVQCLTLLIFLMLVPGLTVNNVIKDNSTGRPRPRQVSEFGGNEAFSGPFQYSGACDKNCSFVSGHATNGYFLMALYWIFQRRRWLLIGIIAGGVAGIGRVVQGAHFLSDIIFAGWISYFLFAALWRLTRKILPRVLGEADVKSGP